MPMDGMPESTFVAFQLELGAQVGVPPEHHGSPGPGTPHGTVRSRSFRDRPTRP